MAYKVYLSPSDQYGNSYAVGSTNEGEQANRICDCLAAALTRCGIAHRRNENMYEAVRESNAWGADLHLPIHTNAFDGKVSGTRMFCYKMHDNTGKETAAYRACRCIFVRLAPITPGTSENIKESSLYETRTTHMPCAYIEVDFHDVPEAAQWIAAHTQDIAEAICRGVCDYFATAYLPPAAPREAPAAVYRVTLPDLDSEQAAQKLCAMLMQAGYGARLEAVRSLAVPAAG